jgi:hypothetical protein
MQSTMPEEIRRCVAAGAACASTGPAPATEGDARPHPEFAAPRTGRPAPTREA